MVNSWLRDKWSPTFVNWPAKTECSVLYTDFRIQIEFNQGTPLPVKESKETKKKPPKKKETLPESIAGFAAVLVSGLFIITFVVQAFEIPSGSMENTLLVGDHVFVDRLTPALKAPYIGPLMAYRPIRRGDIIVFMHPNEPGLHVVKRVIGIPGDHIHLHDGVVYRNGQALNEPYRHPKGGRPDPYRDNFPSYSGAGDPNVVTEWPMLVREHTQDGDLVVPPGYYFGMGDNRENSLDSRYWGFIPGENIIGRPLFIYWSFETPPDQYMRTSLGERVGSLFHTIVHFFDQTRWGRMFHLVR
jgi:signal peptidase I